MRDVRYILLAGGIVAIHAGRAGRRHDAARRRRSVADGAADAFHAVLELDSGRMRALMERAERCSRTHLPDMARSSRMRPRSTLRPGGKRLRPLLVFICAGTDGGSGIASAAAAVELVHMATLVHDDVVDGAPVRRAARRSLRPRARPCDRERATSCSRAHCLLARNGDAEQVRALSDACVALARGELAQRKDAFAADIDIDRYLSRCELKTASLFAAACRLGALAAGAGAEAVTALGAFGRGSARVPGAGRRARRQRARRAHRQGARHRPARGKDDAATDHRARARPRAGALDLRACSSAKRPRAVCDRIAATGAIDESRRGRRELVAEAKAELAEARGARSCASCWSWSPTASSTATRKRRFAEKRPRHWGRGAWRGTLRAAARGCLRARS